MNVYFTVDTESSIGDAWEGLDRHPVKTDKRVFCRIGDEDFGIPLLVRIMKQFGFRGTYFVETLATRCLGEPEIGSIFEYLLKEGQDAQLHIHPVFRHYCEWREARMSGSDCKKPGFVDSIGNHAEDVQMELLTEAIQYFETFAGYGPTAFRAGCYAGSRSLMRSLARLGIRVDSSFNPCYHPDLSFPDMDLQPNVVQNIEGVWEIPVTVARTTLPEGYRGFKFADCSTVSFTEIRSMLDSAAASGLEHFVIVFHSFSAVKPKDGSYSEIRPDRIVIRRLEKMFRYLAEHEKTFRVETMGALAENIGTLNVTTEPCIAQLPRVASVMRKTVQLLNRAYWL